MTAENARLTECTEDENPWRKWGPYLSERQWGTVREDYSESGAAWDYFPHDHARSRAYRHGEDGIAGISDDQQLLCFSMALWNGVDPIIKERLFGLTNGEGNHGEDVKEYYYYLDSTPSHSYMKYLYKYPQLPYPYDQIVSTNRQRNRNEPEFELIDTGVFDSDKYFDIFVEYAKATPTDILIRFTVHNRGNAEAKLELLPTLWFRNLWSFDHSQKKPLIRLVGSGVSKQNSLVVIEASSSDAETMYLYADTPTNLLFTENETNNQRIFQTPNASPYVKDGINDYFVHSKEDGVNPAHIGTKAALHFSLSVPANTSQIVQLRLANIPPHQLANPFNKEFEHIFASRLEEANEFYSSITPANFSRDTANIFRQALAGMLWSKQFYFFDVHQWLRDHGADPLSDSPRACRNKEWFHMLNKHVISMPDKWEYPWYATWDLAFHAIALAPVDPEFAKQQLELTLEEGYQHPNGQLPAYEWNFSDVNPPVNAWASLFLFRYEEKLKGSGDHEFLGRIFKKLLLNFTWWVNRKDREGKNVFEGGFLGLDNIGVFDRSAPLPTGGFLEQADGTAWMAFYAQCMFEIAVILSRTNPDYEELCIKFADHFLLIAWGMNRPTATGMWDEEDGFYYDVLRLPDGSATRLKVRSLVGLLPLCATATFEADERARLSAVTERIATMLEDKPQLAACIHPLGRAHTGHEGRTLAALVNETRLRRILTRMLDEREFLSNYGIRSLSRFHAENPYSFKVGDAEYSVDYQPAESITGAFGGNSNWRGPIWLPVNALIIRALLQFYLYYGNSFQIEFPTGSNRTMNLFEIARELTNRLASIFQTTSANTRPVFGGQQKFQSDPNFRDYLLFYEYFHGESGAGIGASHQTGWTGIIASLMLLFSNLDAENFLKGRFNPRA